MSEHPSLPTVALPGGTPVPALGLGTWRWGEDASRRDDEVAALRAGLDAGLTLVDTAEMYGDAEVVVGEAIAGRRDEVFLVDKVLPGNASRRGTVEACDRSLHRLGTDRIDLYLLHWRGAHDLADTVAAFDELRDAGKIRHWGVSNLDVDDLDELVAVPGGDDVAVNQILYNLSRRGPEWDLLPWAADHGMPIMAYSPVEQGRLLGAPALARVADRHGATPAQIALAWVLDRPGVITIPKASSPERMVENRAAVEITLTDDDRAVLDDAFPPPRGQEPLAIL